MRRENLQTSLGCWIRLVTYLPSRRKRFNTNLVVHEEVATERVDEFRLGRGNLAKKKKNENRYHFPKFKGMLELTPSELILAYRWNCAKKSFHEINHRSFYEDIKTLKYHDYGKIYKSFHEINHEFSRGHQISKYPMDRYCLQKTNIDPNSLHSSSAHLYRSIMKFDLSSRKLCGGH